MPVIKLKQRDYKYEVGEEFTFDGGESSDLDGDELIFAWDFGDGTLSKEKEPTHSFEETGKYQVELVVTDAAGISQRTSMVINIGIPPTASILSPMEGDEFSVGQILHLKGEAFNYKGERLDDSGLTWEVRKHHADHFHPFLDLTHGNDLELFPAPEPEDFFAATNSHLEIILKATDENGLTTLVNRLVQPTRINIGIESDPPDIEVTVDAYPLRTSQQIVSWKNHELNIMANDQPPFLFRSWWDGNKERERKIKLDKDGQLLLAIYCAQEDSSCSVDEECCSGSCEMMTCVSMASSSNDSMNEEHDVDCIELNATDNNITDVNCTDMNITLGNSFVNCTELNVTGGNTTGVNCTDMNMTREPTEAPTEKVKKETTFVSWQFIELGECEGHCSTDSQCKGNLICYERITIDVPGCTNPYNAGFSGIVNVCIDPAELDLPTRESTEAPTKKEKKETTFVSWQFIELGECEGHCSTDSQCKGNLICYERITIGVPGCSNPYNAGFNVDICIDPAELDP